MATATILSTDPIDYALDVATGDVITIGGKLQTIAGIPAVLQGITRRIKRTAGEWFLDLDAGVRWLERDGVTADQAILGQPFDAAKADAEIRAAILDTPAVTAVQSLSITFDNATRTLTIVFEALCSFADVAGDVLASGTVTIGG